MDLQGFGPQLLMGLTVTIRLALAACALGLVLGILGASAKLSSNMVLRGVAEAYTIVFRGLPEFLVVLIIYFGGAVFLSWAIGGGEYVDFQPFLAGTVALGLTFGAYATEVFRGAILNIPKGQTEAALAIGLTRRKVFRRIVLPQVWRLALPGLGNLFLVLLKDTALVSLIGVEDLMRKADMARNFTRDSFTFYAAAAVLYLVLTAITTVMLARMEKRAARGVRGAT